MEVTPGDRLQGWTNAGSRFLLGYSGCVMWANRLPALGPRHPFWERGTTLMSLERRRSQRGVVGQVVDLARLTSYTSISNKQ